MKTKPALVFVMPLLLTACDPAFWEGGSFDLPDLANGGAHDPPDPNDPPGEGGSGGAGGGGGGDSSPLTAAVAMTRAQRDELREEYYENLASETGSAVSTSAAGGGSELDPNDLLLHISDVGESCNIYITHLPCGGHWQLRFALPVAYQQVGVYDINDPALRGFVLEAGEPYSPAPDDCGKGGGTLIQSGTLEILAIDSAEVRFRLTSEDLFLGGNPSGEYTAPRCP
ncbi:hypothetical protein [Sorangium sp. So ce131]|uniref:hypothetical protein n=1 Tax=Sorangium sp. So ce131 TaxID=3133282 RepID=UPI003F6479A6